MPAATKKAGHKLPHNVFSTFKYVWQQNYRNGSFDLRRPNVPVRQGWKPFKEYNEMSVILLYQRSGPQAANGLYLNNRSGSFDLRRSNVPVRQGWKSFKESNEMSVILLHQRSGSQAANGLHQYNRSGSFGLRRSNVPVRQG